MFRRALSRLCAKDRPQPIVAVHYDCHGDASYLVTEAATLYIIDDRAAHDRVYRYDTTSTVEKIRALIGDSRIGHSQDGHLSDFQVDAIRARLWRSHGGELQAVGPVDDE